MVVTRLIAWRAQKATRWSRRPRSRYADAHRSPRAISSVSTMNIREKRSFFPFSAVTPTSLTPKISTAPLGGTILI